MKKEHKIVWMKPSTYWVREPVRIVEKYNNILPKEESKPNFCLQSLRRPCPTCWYLTVPIGINKVRSCVSQMLKNAGLDGNIV